jgi:membrane-associated phospholipid phosphatase
MLGAFAATLLLRPEREAIRVAQTFLLNLFAALPIYLLFPVCGPAFAFPSFPALPLAGLVPHLLAISAAPNGVPSVHMSSALLVLWFLRRWPWGRAIGGVYAALIVLSTLASGQHYLFDLLCAVPYTAAVVWAVDRFAARSAASQHSETFLDQQLVGAA